MATFEIQNARGQIRQSNRGDRLAELWMTKGIDLYSSPGKIKVSRKLLQVLNKTGSGVPSDSRIEGTVQAILVFTNVDQDADNKNYWVITDSRAYRCDISDDPTDFANWEAVNVFIGEVDNTTDSVVFGNNIVTSYGTDISQYNGDSTYDSDWWTAVTSGAALTDSRPHTMMTTRSGQETLHVCDGNVIRLYNTTAGHSSFTLQETLVANVLMSGVNTNWAGTYSNNSQNAVVYSYLIGNDNVSNAYEIDGFAVLSGDVYNNIPYIVTDRGRIQRFNGAGFETVASFPFADEGIALAGQTVGQVNYNTAVSIHPKGMRLVGDRFLINIDMTGSEGAFPANDRSVSGVWEYDPQTGSLHHAYSLAEETTDYGAFRTNSSGPILPVYSNNVDLLVGAGGTGDGLYMDVDETPLAYFVTPEYYGDSITQAWEKITSIHETLASGEEITVKYRFTRQSKYPTFINSVNWLNSSTFNTTDTDAANIEVGDEVEIVNGYRAGYIATVTKVNVSASTYSITLDQTFGIAGESSGIKVENWQLASPTIEQDDGNYLKVGGFGTSPYIQFKVILKGNITVNRFITKGNSKNEQ